MTKSYRQKRGRANHAPEIFVWLFGKMQKRAGSSTVVLERGLKRLSTERFLTEELHEDDRVELSQEEAAPRQQGRTSKRSWTAWDVSPSKPKRDAMPNDATTACGKSPSHWVGTPCERSASRRSVATNVRRINCLCRSREEFTSSTVRKMRISSCTRRFLSHFLPSRGDRGPTTVSRPS